MTAGRIISKALTLLGYGDILGSTADSRFQVISKSALNSIYSDLFYRMYDKGFKEVASLSDKILLPERVLNDVLPYGVAAFIAESLGDGDKQTYFINIYNLKRRSVTRQLKVQDTIPTT